MEEVLKGELIVLKAEARNRGLKETGTKADVRNRIVADMVSKDEGVPKQFAPLMREGENAGGLMPEELLEQEAAQRAADALTCFWM